MAKNIKKPILNHTIWVETVTMCANEADVEIGSFRFSLRQGRASDLYIYIYILTIYIHTHKYIKSHLAYLNNVDE